MQEQDLKQLTLFPEDFPASPSVWLESKKEKGTTVIYGRKCSALSVSLSRVGCLVKMYLESCELPLPTLYRTWSVKDLNASCLILKLRLSARATAGNGSSLWATPNTMDHLPPRSPEALQRQAQGARKGRTRPANLREQADEQIMRMWPTPQASDSKGAAPSRKPGHPYHQSKLCNNLEVTAEGIEGRLNPAWVEWLMGFPASWTDIGK